jgi:hypothetical protein
MRRRAAERMGTSISALQPIFGLPTLQGSHRDPGDLTGRPQPRPIRVSLFDPRCNGLAIFHEYHSSSLR